MFCSGAAAAAIVLLLLLLNTLQSYTLNVRKH
jgi:hypothetical protein